MNDQNTPNIEALAIKQETQKKDNLLKRYWFVILLAFIATILAIVKLILLPEGKPQEIPKQAQESWQGIVAGKSTKQDVLKALGEPASTTADGSVLFYEKPNSKRYHEVHLQGQIVTLTKDMTIGGYLSDYKKRYGESEGEFFGPHKGVGYKLYVFAQSGVAVVAHLTDGEILETWRFPSMSIQQFLSTWGERESLSETEEPVGY